MVQHGWTMKFQLNFFRLSVCIVCESIKISKFMVSRFMLKLKSCLGGFELENYWMSDQFEQWTSRGTTQSNKPWLTVIIWLSTSALKQEKSLTLPSTHPTSENFILFFQISMPTNCCREHNVRILQKGITRTIRHSFSKRA